MNNRMSWISIYLPTAVLTFGTVEALRSWISSGNATTGWLAVALIACLAFLGSWDYRNRKAREQGRASSQ